MGQRCPSTALVLYLPRYSVRTSGLARMPHVILTPTHRGRIWGVWGCTAGPALRQAQGERTRCMGAQPCGRPLYQPHVAPVAGAKHYAVDPCPYPAFEVLLDSCPPSTSRIQALGRAVFEVLAEKRGPAADSTMIGVALGVFHVV